MSVPAESQSGHGWWAKGLLFENCACQLVCPGHLHFDQNCTHERCVGYWAVRFDEGIFDGVDLAGVKAVIAYDTPRHMIDGDWIQGIIIDERAGAEQRSAVEAILTGAAGGPWAKLHPFVGTALPTRYEAIEIEEDRTAKRVSVAGLLKATIEHIRGRDRDEPVRFENMYNQIHNPSQVLCSGETDYDDGTIRVHNRGTHGLYSSFSWAGSGDSP